MTKCKICGNQFVQNRSTQKMCSEQCRRKHDLERHRKRSREKWEKIRQRNQAFNNLPIEEQEQLVLCYMKDLLLDLDNPQTDDGCDKMFNKYGSYKNNGGKTK